jgi:hypothetical protein
MYSRYWCAPMGRYAPYGVLEGDLGTEMRVIATTNNCYYFNMDLAHMQPYKLGHMDTQGARAVNCTLANLMRKQSVPAAAICG